MIINSKTFSVWLAKVKAENGLSSKELAQKCNITSASVNGFLTGRQFPTLGTMELIADAFGKKIKIE